MVEAIKEQQTIIEEQNSKINDLETQLNKLIALLQNGGLDLDNNNSPSNEDGQVPSKSRILDEGHGNILNQNHPNPFTKLTTISYQISESGNVELTFYSNNGQEVVKLVNTYKEKGTYTEEWVTENLPTGLYFYVLKLDGIELVRKALHVK